MEKILVVDDERDNLDLVAHILQAGGMEYDVAASGAEALAKMDGRQFPVVLTDLMMPRMNGIQLLEKVKESWPDTEVIIITAHGSIKSAIEAIRKGAYGYILKPFEPDELRLEIGKALGLIRIKRENRALQAVLAEARHPAVMVGDSPKINAIRELVKSVASTNATILITGESGTGKELVANAIHNSSERRNGPFVKVNCAALAETLLESELFGHEKGSFTGAIAQKKGKFEAADGGTIFLDEIGEISQALQVRLLRVLQEREFQRVGGTKSVNVDVRVISATNRNIAHGVRDGWFREDLFYRLNVIAIEMPALRERREDVPELAKYFLEKFRVELNKNVRSISDGAMKRLTSYDWPGNIRELQNVLERSVVLSDHSVIGEADLPENLNLSSSRLVSSGEERLVSFKEAKRRFEKEFIEAALAQNSGNISRTAVMIQLARKNLQDKIKAYGIDVGSLSDWDGA
ncbi:MAG: sigma-54-dependent Fis family transcriptional regulator [Nitrospinae bacterium]|nr:sigma-54-dependent Fis family transcriptional regulator [Nitrospinota bacterium]